MADLLILPNQQLARRIISLSLRTNELSNAIQLSKEHMDKVRGDKARAIRLEKQTAQTRLKEQKSHYEGIVTRHQGFIEQVLHFYIYIYPTYTTIYMAPTLVFFFLFLFFIF